MVPIHDSDLAEKRWKEDEWKEYELWEKLEERQTRKRLVWIAFTAILFICILAIPVLRDHFPKWKGLDLVRRIAQEANELKLEASSRFVPLRMAIVQDSSGISYSVFRVENCHSSNRLETFRTEPLLSALEAEELRLIDLPAATALGLEKTTLEFCYDPVEGDPTLAVTEDSRAIGVVPVKDLATSPPRLDRISVVGFNGHAAEISFD